MNRNLCIYYRQEAGACVCVKLAHCKPHCPWHRHGECAVAGNIGRQGILANQRETWEFRLPAPTLLRWATR